MIFFGGDLKKILKNFISDFNQRRKIRCLLDGLNFFSNILFYLKVKRRRQLSIESILPLSKNLPILSLGQYCRVNNAYGISQQLLQYAGYSGKINAYIEHGIEFSEFVDEFIITYDTDYTLTFGENRQAPILNRGKIPILVGPYIHYAKNLFDEEAFDSLKRKYGKCFVFFPAHSTAFADVVFDYEATIAKLRSFYKDFDRIVVCLFWKDVQKKQHIPYLQAGFAVVTAGHMFDPDFLPRLKTIISLADLTASNSLGTHVGYCIYLGKEYLHIDQEIGQDGLEKHFENYSVDPLFQYTERERQMSSVTQIYKTIFTESGSTLTEKKKEFCNYFWGFDHVKSPRELYDILRKIS